MPDSVDERIARAAAGCEESRLLMSRRAVLGVTTGLFSWAYAPRWATATAGEASSDPRFLVVVLRGGMDGLSTVVPFGDNSYYSLRGDIAIPRNKTIKLDGFFGLHPAMRRFGKMYRKGQAAVVHAACVPLRTRSHFDTQDNLENGYPDAVVSNSTGWLNRLLQALPDISAARRLAATQEYLSRAGSELAPAERETIAAQVLRVLDDPSFQEAFRPASRAEVPIVGKLTIDGETVRVSGQIDRLAVTEDSVLICDFKTNRLAPRRIEEVPKAYITQLALYRALLEKLYPGRAVRAALLWTEVPDLMELSGADLDQALARTRAA